MVMADMLDKQQSLPPRDERLVLAVDLGTGGPKVGFVTARGEVALVGAHAGDDDAGPTASARQDAEEWWRLIVATLPVAGSSTARSTAVTSSPSRDRPVGEHRAGRRARRARSATCIMWRTPAARAYSQDGDRRSGRRLRARAAGHLGPAQRRRPEHRRRRPDRPHAPPGARPPGGRGRRAVVPRAGRLPDDALHGRGGRVAGVDDRRLADRQPRRSTCWPTTTTWSGWRGVDATEAAAARARPARSSARCAPRSPPSSASRRRLQVVTGAPDLHSAAVGAGRRRPLRGATWRSAPPSWISAPVPRKKTDVIRQMASVPGLDHRHATCSPTTTRPPAAACSGCATTVAPEASLRRRCSAEAATAPRRARTGCCSRRG